MSVVDGMLAAGDFTDPKNAHTILLAAGGLVLLAVVVLVGTVWWWHSTKSDHPVLAPLEVMGTRKWWKSDYTERRQSVEKVRPAGGDDDADAEPEHHEIDLHAAAAAEPTGFDDLLDPDLMVTSAEPVVETPVVETPEIETPEIGADDATKVDIPTPVDPLLRPSASE